MNDLLVERSAHGCTLVSSDTFTGVLVAGGFNGDFLRNSEILDLSTGVWHEVGHLNYRRHQFKISAMAGKIVALGGYMVMPTSTL